jgi:hypothetical protein
LAIIKIDEADINHKDIRINSGSGRDINPIMAGGL